MLWRIDNEQKEFARWTAGFGVPSNQNVRIENDPHPRAVPHMIDGFIDLSVDILISDVSDLLCPAIKECLKLLRNGQAITRRRNLLRRNRSDADFLVGANWSAQELLDSGLHALWQVAGPLDGDIRHTRHILFNPIVPRDGYEPRAWAPVAPDR